METLKLAPCPGRGNVEVANMFWCKDLLHVLELSVFQSVQAVWSLGKLLCSPCHAAVIPPGAALGVFLFEAGLALILLGDDSQNKCCFS